MLFNSSIFILGFLPITLLIFWLLSRFRLTQGVMIWLLISSLIFYAYWNLFDPAGQGRTIHYIFLIILSIVINHQLGSAIAAAEVKSRKAQVFLIIGIVLNLGIIAYYKYANFFLDSINHWFPTNYHFGQLILPLGISFYTFTQIGYLVDAYRGEIKGENYQLPTYGLFILFFPQLIAGPILRHDELIPQFRRLRNFIFSPKNFAMGSILFSLGLSKKVIIADSLSPWVKQAFDHANDLTFIEAWVGALSYTFQLYFDFSGYSDMAIGLGLMFNIVLPINFNSPYKATSISDFWRRWHITLSNFLRDYLYIPLGGNRRGQIRQYANLIVTMLLGGLWHGAGWTFVIWGGLHGGYLSLNHAWRKLKIPLPVLVGWILTFLAVVVSWVIFRASNLHDGMTIIQTMFGMNGITLPVGQPQGKFSFLSLFGIELKRWNDFNYLPQFQGKASLTFLYLIALTSIVSIFPNSQEIVPKISRHRGFALGLGLLVGYCIFSLNQVSEFLYFQF